MSLDIARCPDGNEGNITQVKSYWIKPSFMGIKLKTVFKEPNVVLAQSKQ